jgi:hypothetical protein
VRCLVAEEPQITVVVLTAAQRVWGLPKDWLEIGSNMWVDGTDGGRFLGSRGRVPIAFDADFDASRRVSLSGWKAGGGCTEYSVACLHHI